MVNLFSCLPAIQMTEYLKYGFMFSYYVALESVVIERFIAIYQLDKYEKNNYSIGIIISGVCQVIGVFIGTGILYYGLFRYLIWVDK